MKDQAKELVEKHYKLIFGGYDEERWLKAKQHALICVDEIIKALQHDELSNGLIITGHDASEIDRVLYYQQLKQEIEKL